MCSEQTSGSPGSQYPRAPASPRRGPQVRATSAARRPQSSRTSRARPQPYRAAELPRRRRGQCPRGGRPPARAVWPPAPAERPGPIADHLWLAAGAPAPARLRPLQLAAKFMPAALQRRPQSARSIPTARLRAARPEGGVSGVYKLLIGISHCCVTRGGGDTHAAHSHTLTLAATSGSGLKGEATPPRPRPRRPRAPKRRVSRPGGGRG